MSDKGTKSDTAVQWPTAHFSAAAGIGALLLVGGLGVWGGSAQLSSAVIAPGEVRVASNRQVVQHRAGGTVAAIMARDGDVVRRGDIIMRLNDTQLRAKRAILQRGLDKNLARHARLSAERDGASEISFGANLVNLAPNQEKFSDLMNAEIRLFTARRDTHRESRAVLASRIAQIEHEIAGFEGQVAAAELQREIVQQETALQRQLLERGLERRIPLIERKLELARIERDLAAFRSDVAAARSRIGEHRISLNRLDATRLEEIVKELHEVDIEFLDLEDELRMVDDDLANINVTAPVDGIVHASTVHTPGAVISPAVPVVAVVPTAERLVIEVHVPPESIDDTHPGQHAIVRFPAFNARTTPELQGTVKRVSADRMVNEDNQRPYYAAEVTVPERELRRLNGGTLVPGMPAEVFVQTGQRTPLSYLLKPLSDHMRHAMREE